MYMKHPFLKLILLVWISCAVVAANAQETVEQDTIRGERKMDLPVGKDMNTSPNLLDKSAISTSIDNTTEMVTLPKFEVEPDPASAFRVEHETVHIAPYQYSSFSPWEGLIMQGVSGHFVANNFLTANLNLFVSSTYFGPFQPNPYINGSLRMSLEFKVHDRVQLVGLGQISVREGLNPNMPTYLGGSNYYGAGMKIKITDKLGIGFGVTNSYYRKNWTPRPYLAPVAF